MKKSQLIQLIKESLNKSSKDTTAQKQFKMNYSQLGKNEKEWVDDEIDNIEYKKKKKKVNENSQLEEISGAGKYTIVAAAMAVLALGAVYKTKSNNKEIQTALSNGDSVKVSLDKELGVFTKHSDHSTDYYVKVNSSQTEPIKVDTSSNIVTIKSIDVANGELARNVSNAVRKVDPSLAANWEDLVKVGKGAAAPGYANKDLTNITINKK